MATIHADSDKNCLYITLSGVVCGQQATEAKTAIVELVAGLQPGFAVINDISQAECGYLSTLPLLQEIITLLIEKKVGRVIRVVDRSSVIFQQMTQATKELGEYPVEWVGSLEEAEALLMADAATA